MRDECNERERPSRRSESESAEGLTAGDLKLAELPGLLLPSRRRHMTEKGHEASGAPSHPTSLPSSSPANKYKLIISKKTHARSTRLIRTRGRCRLTGAAATATERKRRPTSCVGLGADRLHTWPTVHKAAAALFSLCAGPSPCWQTRTLAPALMARVGGYWGRGGKRGQTVTNAIACQT